MVRVLQILSICTLLSAGGVFALSVSLWRQDDPQLDEIRSRPSAIEVFKESGSRASDCSGERPPLIVQAEAFALLLNPPKSAEKPPAALLTVSSKPAMPPIRPMAPSVNFKLRATSCYPHQPGKSMALVSELGSTEGSERWVREGSQLGHFVIGEIRRGSITYRDGDQLREMTVEHASSPPNIVRDIRPGSRQVSAAVGGANVLLSASVDTNSVEVGGQD
jgi:hypothetical protein